MKKACIIRFAAICGLVLTSAAAAKQPTKAASAKPKINSVTFSASVPLKPGDIITVDLAGTPKGKAAFSVKGLIPITYLREMSPGSYHGSVTVPKGRAARNAPLVGYLGVGSAHAPPVQAARLVTVVDSADQKLQPTVPPLGMTKPGPKPVSPPAKLPPVKTEPPRKPAPAPPPKPVETPKPPPAPPTPPAPEPEPNVTAPAPSKIVLTSPVDGAVARRAIVVRGNADPGSVVKVTITYSNHLTGVLKLAGEVLSQNLSVGDSGEFRAGPIALDGPLATNGLKFTIKAYYPDRADHGAAQVSVTGR